MHRRSGLAAHLGLIASYLHVFWRLGITYAMPERPGTFMKNLFDLLKAKVSSGRVK
jgi:hypothetical protein